MSLILTRLLPVPMAQRLAPHPWPWTPFLPNLFNKKLVPSLCVGIHSMPLAKTRSFTLNEVTYRADRPRWLTPRGVESGVPRTRRTRPRSFQKRDKPARSSSSNGNSSGISAVTMDLLEIDPLFLSIIFQTVVSEHPDQRANEGIMYRYRTIS
jgi:hypothetical protein